MAKAEIQLRAHTQLARAVLIALYPAVMLRLISPERAANIVARFVRVSVN